MPDMNFINLNDIVYVKLHPYIEEIVENGEEHNMLTTFHEIGWHTGWYKFQMWEILYHFGRYCTAGSEFPFQDGRIYVEKPIEVLTIEERLKEAKEKETDESQ